MAPARQLWYAFPQADRTDLTENVPEAMVPPNVIRLIMVFLCGAFASLEQTFAFMPSLQPTAYLLLPAYSVEALRQATFGAVQYPVLLIDLVGLALAS